jgi:hypothetical protein
MDDGDPPVVKLVPKSLGEGFVFPTDEILASVKDGEPRILVCAYLDKDGEVQVSGTHSATEALMMLMRAVNQLTALAPPA